MSFKEFDDKTTTTDLNGPRVAIKTDAYGHEPGELTTKSTVCLLYTSPSPRD